MKIVRILLFVFIFLVKSFAQETDFTQCNGTLTIEGEEIALEGGKFKPSSNAPGEYFRALVVYVQFVPDGNLVSDWTSGQLPDWAFDIFDSSLSYQYTEGTVSDYFKDMARGDFDFIADVHPNLIWVPEYKRYDQANLNVLAELNEQIGDFSIYDN